MPRLFALFYSNCPAKLETAVLYPVTSSSSVAVTSSSGALSSSAFVSICGIGGNSLGHIAGRFARASELADKTGWFFGRGGICSCGSGARRGRVALPATVPVGDDSGDSDGDRGGSAARGAELCRDRLRGDIGSGSSPLGIVAAGPAGPGVTAGVALGVGTGVGPGVVLAAARFAWSVCASDPWRRQPFQPSTANVGVALMVVLRLRANEIADGCRSRGGRKCWGPPASGCGTAVGCGGMGPGCIDADRLSDGPSSSAPSWGGSWLTRGPASDFCRDRCGAPAGASPGPVEFCDG